MSDTVNFAELDEQYVELLPARNVLSMLGLQAPDGGIGTDGASDTGGVGMVLAGIPIGDASNGMGGAGTSANG